MVEPDARHCPRQARVASLAASTLLQEPEPDARARSQHGSYANDYHIDNPAPEDSVPPIGDECQLPLDFAQAYGITAIRVLTTSQAPTWSANSYVGAKTLQDLAILPPEKPHAQLKDSQIIPVPVVRVVVDGRVTHQFRWSHPIIRVIDPNSETAGPLISPSTARCAVLCNVSPSIATCLSGCQHLPIRAVRAEGQTSGPSGTMEHGSLCMLVIYGMTPAAAPAVSCAQLPSNLAGRLKRINTMLGRSTGASSPAPSQPAGTSTHRRHQAADRSGEPPSAKASVEGRAQRRPRRKCTAPSTTPGGTPATSSVTPPPAVTAQQPQQEGASTADVADEGPQHFNTTGSRQAGTAHDSGAGMSPPPSPSRSNKNFLKKRKRRQSEAAAQTERSGTAVLDPPGAEGPALSPSAEGQVAVADHAPPPASPPPPATPHGVSTHSSKRPRLNPPAAQPSSTPHASLSSKRVLRNTGARQARAQAQAQQQPATLGKKKRDSTKHSLPWCEASITAAPDACAGRAGPADQQVFDAACTGQEQSSVSQPPEQQLDITRNQPGDETQTAAMAGQASPPLAGPSSTATVCGTPGGVGPDCAHQPTHAPSTASGSHQCQQHVGAGEEEEAPQGPELVRQGTPAAAAAAAAGSAPTALAPPAVPAPVMPAAPSATAATPAVPAPCMPLQAAPGPPAPPPPPPLPTVHVRSDNSPATDKNGLSSQADGLDCGAGGTYSNAPSVPFRGGAQDLVHPVTAEGLLLPLSADALPPPPLPPARPTAPPEQPSQLAAAHAALDGAQGPSTHAGDGRACPVTTQDMSTAGATTAHGEPSSPAAQDRPTKKIIIRFKRSAGSNPNRAAQVLPQLPTPLTPTPPEAVPPSSRAAVGRDFQGVGMATDTRAAAPSAKLPSAAAVLTSQFTDSPERVSGVRTTGQPQLGVDTCSTEPGACLVPHTQLSLDAPPVVPIDDGGVLPPAGAECQLPDDLIQVYGIQSTQVLTSSEPLSLRCVLSSSRFHQQPLTEYTCKHELRPNRGLNVELARPGYAEMLRATRCGMFMMPCRPHNDLFKHRVLLQLGIEIPGHHSMHQPMSIPIPVLRVVIDGHISHQFAWSYPIEEYSSEGLAEGPAFRAYPSGGAICMRNIRPSLRILLKGCEQLPARAVRAVGTTSGPAGTMQHGALCMVVVYAKTTSYHLASPQQQQQQQQQSVDRLIADVDNLLSSLQQGDAAGEPAAQGPRMQGSGSTGVPLIAALAPATVAPAVTALPAPELTADQGVGADDVPTSSPGCEAPTARTAPLGRPQWCSTGTVALSPNGLLDQLETQQGNTLGPGGAGQDSMVWPALGRPAQRAALPPLPHDTMPPAGDECRLPAAFAESYGIRAIKVLTTREPPAWGCNGVVAKPLLHDLGISLPQRCTDCNSDESLFIAVPFVRVVIDSMVAHQAWWPHPIPLDVLRGSLTREAGPVITRCGKGQIAVRHMRPRIHALLRGCERLPAKAVRAVGTTSGPAGTMQDGGLCMLVVYAKRKQSAASQPDSHEEQQQQQPQPGLMASEAAPAAAASQAATGGTEPQGVALHSHPATSADVPTVGGPVVLNLGEHDFFQPTQDAPPASSAQHPLLSSPNLVEAGTVVQPTSTACTAVTEPGMRSNRSGSLSPALPTAAGQEHEGTSLEPPNSPAPAPTPVPATAPAPDNVGMELGIAAPESALHEQPGVSSDEDGGPHVLLEGPAPAQPQLPARSGLDVEGSTPRSAQAGHPEGCVPQPAVHPAVPHVVPTAVPHVVPAIPQPIGDECQLPADFILAYGIRATKILTTRQAPGWDHNGFMMQPVLHDLGISLFDKTFEGSFSLAVPIVRVVIDNSVTHQARWPYPIPLDVVRGSLAAVKEAGPAIVTYVGRHTLKGLRPSMATLLRGCERLPARAVRAVGTSSGPAGTMQEGGLCMLVIYAKRIQSAGPASPIASLPVTGAAATEGMAPPDEPRAAGGSRQCTLLTGAAQEAGPNTISQLTHTPWEQEPGQADGQEHERISPPSSPALALGPASVPAPAAPIDECLAHGSDTPGRVQHEPASSSDADGVLMPAASLLPQGPAATQPQLPASSPGVHGITPQWPQAGDTGGCIPQPAVPPGVPDVGHQAGLPPAGDECRLPPDFAGSYGIRSTSILTTRQAPAWGHNGFINQSELLDLGISLPHSQRSLSLAVPIVRVVIDGMVTHQARWSHPVPLRVVRARLTGQAGPVILKYVWGYSTLENLSPSINTLLQGCERLQARAVRAVNSTSGPAGTMQHAGLCMLVIYAKRVQPAAPQPDSHAEQQQQQQQQQAGNTAAVAAPNFAAGQAARGRTGARAAAAHSHPATSISAPTAPPGHVVLNLGQQDASQPTQGVPLATSAQQPLLPFPNLTPPPLGSAGQPANATGGAAAAVALPPVPPLVAPLASKMHLLLAQALRLALSKARAPPAHGLNATATAGRLLPQSAYAASAIAPACMAPVAGSAAPPAGRPEGTCTAEVRPAAAGVQPIGSAGMVLLDPGRHGNRSGTLSPAAAAENPVASALAAADRPTSAAPASSSATGEEGAATAVHATGQLAESLASERREPGGVAGHAQGLPCPAVPQHGGDGITYTTIGHSKRRRLDAPAGWSGSIAGQSGGVVPQTSEQVPVGTQSPAGTAASAPECPSSVAAALMSGGQPRSHAEQANEQQQVEHAAPHAEDTPGVAPGTASTPTVPGTAFVPAIVPDTAPLAAGNTTAASSAGGPTTPNLAQNGALVSTQDTSASATQMPVFPPHLPLPLPLPDFGLLPVGGVPQTPCANANAEAEGASKPQLPASPAPPPALGGHSSAQGRAAPPSAGRPAGSSTAGGHATGPQTQVTDPPTAQHVPSTATELGMHMLFSTTADPALPSPAASHHCETGVPGAAIGSREQRCSAPTSTASSLSAPPPAEPPSAAEAAPSPAGHHFPHQLGEPARCLSAECTQDRHTAALPSPSTVSAPAPSPLVAGAAATAASPPLLATPASPVAAVHRNDQPKLLPSPPLPSAEQATAAPYGPDVCEQSAVALQEPCTTNAGSTALPLVLGHGPSLGESTQPSQARDAGNAHQPGAPSITRAVKSLSLPPIDLPQAGLTDSTRAYLCQQLMRSLLAAARALYDAQPDSKLDTLVQQLLEVPSASLIQFLERRYEVLRMALEVQPDARMAEVAGRLLWELCSMQ